MLLLKAPTASLVQVADTELTVAYLPDVFIPFSVR